MSNDNTPGTEIINAQISALRSQNIQTGENADYQYPYVIFQLFENKFALNCKYVVSIEQVTETKELVKSSSEIRGIAYYKNEPINVFDLRRVFGMMSSEEYIRNVVNIPQRIIDHEKYVQTLKDCVDSKKPFELTVDSAKCAFGKWFYAYKNKSLPVGVRKEFDKIEIVHAKFHNAAKTVKDFIARKRTDEAAKYMREVEDIKQYVISALNDLNEVMLKNVTEINIVLQLKDKKIGIIVDAADSVEEIDDIQELPPTVAMTKYISRLGLSKKERQIVFILEANEFNNH